MRKCKCLLIAALAITLMVGLLAGCKGKSDSVAGGSSTKPTEILFEVMCGEEEFATWEECVVAFQKKFPNIKVKMENVPGDWEGYNQKLLTLIAAGTPPDVGRIGSLQMPQYSSMGQLKELSELVKRDINMSEYDAEVFEQAKVNGGLYGLPVGVYTLFVCYNKTLFDQAGIPYPSTDWNNTWTLAEFQDIARRLTKGTGPNKTYGFYANLNLERSNSFYYSEGGDVFSDDHTKCTLDQKPMVDTYNWLVKMIQDGYAPNMLQANRAPPSDELFMSDRLGMYLEGEWAIPTLMRAEGLKFGVAPIPKGAADSTTVLFLDDYVVFTASKYQDESWQLVKYLIEGEAEEIIAKNQAFGMLMHKPTTEKMRNQMFTALTNDEKNVLFDSPNHAKAMYFTNNWHEMLQAAQKNIDLFVLGDISVPEGLRRMTADLDALNAVNLK